ncbi:MAG: bacteriohemerythrin [Pyrinomonadaceae bacterium]
MKERIFDCAASSKLAPGEGAMREYRSAMDAMEESTELNFGVAEMDREHAGQLSLLNDLKAAVRGGAPDSLVYALLNDLVEHTNLHFLSEQLAMKLHAYEACESHLLEHERLLLEVQNLKSSLATATAADKQSLIEALRGWLVVHIQTADRTLAEYLSTRTAQPGT